VPDALPAFLLSISVIGGRAGDMIDGGGVVLTTTGVEDPAILLDRFSKHDFGKVEDFFQISMILRVLSWLPRQHQQRKFRQGALRSQDGHSTAIQDGLCVPLTLPSLHTPPFPSSIIPPIRFSATLSILFIIPSRPLCPLFALATASNK
jgi:hypothetical protein